MSAKRMGAVGLRHRCTKCTIRAQNVKSRRKGAEIPVKKTFFAVC